MIQAQSIVTLDNAAARRLLAGELWFSEHDVLGRVPRIAGIARVLDRRKRFLGMAFLSPGSRYFLRMITRDDVSIDRAFLRERIVRANKRRSRLADLTNAYRVVYSEADGIPSVIVDRYNDIFAIQITSSGAETIKALLIDIIIELFHPASVVEKGAITVRASEDLPIAEGIVYGDKQVTIIREGDQLFELDVLCGQKTGAYLDYRGFRLKARDLARGDCLDAFCYQGWFSCHIARSARHIVAVDSSKDALDAAAVNARLNRHGNIEFVRADAFDTSTTPNPPLKGRVEAPLSINPEGVRLSSAEVHTPPFRAGSRRVDYLAGCDHRFDFIHIDPPAMAKEHAKLAQAAHGYKKLIANALRILNDDGVLMISSCSHKISERILEETVLDCIKKAARHGEVIWRGIQDVDHPVLRGLPESLYLKALAVRV